jgi:threonine synthase
MRYVSTRGGLQPSSFSEILLGGLGPDGGLVVPEEYPKVDAATLASWRGLSYPQLAFEVLRRYAGDIGESTLRALIERTYTEQVFGSADITPVMGLEDELYLLRLSNGPTLAFKDVAMQLLGNLFEHVLEQQGRQLNILGATSGDTGSAAEYAMRGKHGISVFMLSPHGRMSAFQRAQMFSLRDPNVFNIAVYGVFDDCQDMVKAVSADLGFKSRYAIGTVNSINWARVVAQVVYYFKAWLAVTQADDELVSFSVPSGNFGNVLAGHIARMMGLPIRRLVVATNENDVLDEFFRTGRYRARASLRPRRPAARRWTFPGHRTSSARVRPAGRDRSASPRCGASSTSAASSTWPARRSSRGSPTTDSCPGAAPMPTGSPPSARLRRSTASRWTRTPPTGCSSPSPGARPG